MESDTTQQETTTYKPRKWVRVVGIVCLTLAVLFICSKYPLFLWALAGTSSSPTIVSTRANPAWNGVYKYGMSDNVAYYVNTSPIPTDKECLAIDLCLRGFKEENRNVYDVGCYMVFPNYPDSIVRGNRLVVYLHNGDSAQAMAYEPVTYPQLIPRKSRHMPRSLKAERYCDYAMPPKFLLKLLQETPDSIKVESANGQIVRPASKKANLRLQQRYAMLEDYLNE